MIELELRGECTDTYDELKKKLDAAAEKERVPSVVERRTFVAFFGTVGEQGIDIRCRVTNGEAEVVAKVGAFHAHDRIEVSQNVSLEQMIGFAKMFVAMGFADTKVCFRHQVHYRIADVDVALVRSQSGLAYVELERQVSDAKELDVEKVKLEILAKQLGITLWKTGEEFYAFCRRLTVKDDWQFVGSNEDITRLYRQIQETESDQRSG